MKTDIEKTIAAIKEKLNSITEMMAWIIEAEMRGFHVGQRVEFSRRAHERGIVRRKRSQRGTIKAVKSFGITVLLDGYKHPKNFHHSFFNPVSGPKLF
jgi:hypothetical protein